MMFERFFNNFFVRTEEIRKRDFSRKSIETTQSFSTPSFDGIGVSPVAVNYLGNMGDLSLSKGEMPGLNDISSTISGISDIYENMAKNQTIFKYQTVKPKCSLIGPLSYKNVSQNYWGAFKTLNKEESKLFFEEVKDEVGIYGIKVKRAGIYKISAKQRMGKANLGLGLSKNFKGDLKNEPTSFYSSFDRTAGGNDFAKTDYVGILSAGDIITAGSQDENKMGQTGLDSNKGTFTIEFLNDIEEFFGLKLLTFKNKSEAGYIPFFNNFVDALGLLKYDFNNIEQNTEIFQDTFSNFNSNVNIVYSTLNVPKVTLSFEILWNGNDAVMPLSFNDSAIMIKKGILGISDKSEVIGAKIEKNKWYHIFVIFNGEQSEIIINGKKGVEATGKVDLSKTLLIKNNFQINGNLTNENPTTNNSNFGAIRNLRLYNEALNEFSNNFKFFIPESRYYVK